MPSGFSEKADIITRLDVLLKTIEELKKGHRRHNIGVARAIIRGLIRDIKDEGVKVRVDEGRRAY